MKPALLFLFSFLAAAQTPDYKALYDAHQWSALAKAPSLPVFYRGALAAVFNDRAHAEPLLKSVIRASPKSEAASEARNLLRRLLFDSGQFQRLKQSGGEPPKDYAPFLELPDQITVSSKWAKVKHNGGVEVSLTVNGKPADFFLDTGAAVSAISETEATRLGMTIKDTGGKIGTSTGSSMGFRTAVAENLIVGGTHLRNVSFLVFPDTQEPWSVLAPGHRGLLGVPVLLGLHRLAWSKDGTMEIGPAPVRRAPARKNLYFDNDHMALTVTFQGRDIPMTLDSGAQTTDIYGKFGTDFTAFTAGGERTSQEVRGIGNAQSFDSVKVPALPLRIGGFDTELKPGVVILKQLGPAWSYGNVGTDLLRQAGSYVIDFDSMNITLTK